VETTCFAAKAQVVKRSDGCRSENAASEAKVQAMAASMEQNCPLLYRSERAIITQQIADYRRHFRDDGSLLISSSVRISLAVLTI
jgi:hypothetical protein